MNETRFILVTALALALFNGTEARGDDGELLYNGIRLPKEWPPMTPIKDRSVKAEPEYLLHPPTVIPVDVGRQLFVDDFLIGNTTLTRQFHRPERYAGNPVLKAETPIEMNGGNLPLAAMISDGVCYDFKDRTFRMWYQAGWRDGTMMALSKDGLHWTRPALDVEPGSNRVLPGKPKMVRHGTGIAMDPYTTDPAQRFKMLIFENDVNKTSAYISPDGAHWAFKGYLPECGDNTTIFYNPFRKKWVFSLRLYRMGRARNYHEASDFLEGIRWDKATESPWANTDELDLPDPGMMARMPKSEEIRREAETTGRNYDDLLKQYRGLYGDPTQLYNLDAIPYESLMLGVFSILRGPTAAKVWDKLKTVKLCDLELAYSRDGFNWHRPDRTPFLASTRKEGDWDRGYLHAGVGICTVVGDQLYFYYSGWSGISPARDRETYAGGATGVAMLRRDGFASMDADAAPGTLTTRTLTFKGSHLFVNLDAPNGELRAEMLDASGKTIEPFTLANSVPITGNSTRRNMAWNGADDLGALADKPVKLRFVLRQGSLYSFWITSDPKGASHGYVAAGGPEFSGPIDDGETNLTSRVPKFTFATSLSGQETQLKTNVLVTRFVESRQKMAGDPHRPGYHYVNPEGKLNDPNGLCFWQGQWHLFYQAYPPEDPRQHWGHAVSIDLIHWRDLPYAIYPNPEEKCYSGATWVEKDRVIAMYHGTRVGNMVATSRDPLLLNWEKVGGAAVIPSKNSDGTPLPYHVYDPCIWKKDDFYYSLSGSASPGPGGKTIPTEYLFRSRDLAKWEYLHPFVEGDRFTLPGDDGACPYFWPIGDRHILLFFSHMSGGQYLLGDYDRQRDQFKATAHGRFNFGPAMPAGVHAPSATPDGQGGVIAIFNMNQAKPTRGWNGIMTLPRRLTLAGKNELGIEPAGDIGSLRQSHEHIEAMKLPANEEVVLDQARGNSVEIIAEIDPRAAPSVELDVLRSPDRGEYTRIAFYKNRGFVRSRVPGAERSYSVITLDSSFASQLPDVLSRAPESAQVALEPDESLKLSVFIDRSVVEVFVNGKQCVATRVYPGRADSIGVSLRSQGRESLLKSLDIWQMENIYEGPR